MPRFRSLVAKRFLAQVEICEKDARIAIPCLTQRPSFCHTLILTQTQAIIIPHAHPDPHPSHHNSTHSSRPGPRPSCSQTLIQTQTQTHPDLGHHNSTASSIQASSRTLLAQDGRKMALKWLRMPKTSKPPSKPSPPPLQTLLQTPSGHLEMATFLLSRAGGMRGAIE